MLHNVEVHRRSDSYAEEALGAHHRFSYATVCKGCLRELRHLVHTEPARPGSQYHCRVRALGLALTAQ